MPAPTEPSGSVRSPRNHSSRSFRKSSSSGMASGDSAPFGPAVGGCWAGGRVVVVAAGFCGFAGDAEGAGSGFCACAAANGLRHSSTKTLRMAFHFAHWDALDVIIRASLGLRLLRNLNCPYYLQDCYRTSLGLWRDTVTGPGESSAEERVAQFSDRFRPDSKAGNSLRGRWAVASCADKFLETAKNAHRYRSVRPGTLLTRGVTVSGRTGSPAALLSVGGRAGQRKSSIGSAS